MLKVDPVYVDVPSRVRLYDEIDLAKKRLVGKKRRRIVFPPLKVEDFVATGPSPWQSAEHQYQAAMGMRLGRDGEEREWLEVNDWTRHWYRRTFNFDGVDVALKEDSHRRYLTDDEFDDDDVEEVLTELAELKDSKVDMAKLFSFAL